MQEASDGSRAHVFMSYAEEDTDSAVAIAEGLEAEGYRVWYYSRDTVAGVPHVRQVLDAIEGCQGVCVIVSQCAIASQHVDREIYRAYAKRKGFFPILRDMTYDEFREHQPEWDHMLGAAVAVELPGEGVAEVLPRLIEGLKRSGIAPGEPTPAEARRKQRKQPRQRKAREPEAKRPSKASAEPVRSALQRCADWLVMPYGLPTWQDWRQWLGTSWTLGQLALVVVLLAVAAALALVAAGELRPAQRKEAWQYYVAGRNFALARAYHQAADAFRGAVELKPTSAFSRWDLAVCLEKTNQSAEAQRQWDLCARSHGLYRPTSVPVGQVPFDWEKDPASWPKPAKER